MLLVSLHDEESDRVVIVGVHLAVPPYRPPRPALSASRRLTFAVRSRPPR